MTTDPYIGVQADGPLLRACHQVFNWGADSNLTVVIWHDGWAKEDGYWSGLEKRIREISTKHRILVTFFPVDERQRGGLMHGDTSGIEEFRSDKEVRHLLPLLFRLLGQDPDYPKGWCPITTFDRLGGAYWEYDPKDDRQGKLRERTNEILGLAKSEKSDNAITSAQRTVSEAWELLAGGKDDHTRIVRSVDALRACDGLVELNAKPGILVLDDLAGYESDVAFANWTRHLQELRRLFSILSPVLPLHERHAKSVDDLLPVIQAEIYRLRRPLGAVVDMQWVFGDRDSIKDPNAKARWFGLELIRLLKRAKPSLPLFVWSPIQDRQILQRAMQLGASSCFDKDHSLAFRHDLAGIEPASDNQLDAGGLWFRILEWERTRYTCPPVGSSDGDFILATTPEAAKCRKTFLKNYELNESDLLGRAEPAVVRLLRALVPDAIGVEILRFFGEGQSRTERPFVVRGQTAAKRWLRPIQIKLSRDWRALAREGKGYRDVFAERLGPSVAHVLKGPFRLEDWCGMAQSFAAPEEAIRDISSKTTRSLEEWLRERLPEPQKCVQLVDEIFDGVLDPLYKENLTQRAKSVFKAFDRVGPAHLEAEFEPVEENQKDKDDRIDFAPEELSRKDAKHRREMAYRHWREVEDWWNGQGRRKGDSLDIAGLVAESLEIDPTNPHDSRLRLLDTTVGVKVDLKAGDSHTARRWQALAESPIKLVGLPVEFRIRRKREDGKDRERNYLLLGWTRTIEKLLKQSGVLEVGNGKGPRPNRTAWDQCSHFFYPLHPIDWSEEFHIGPTHGDLNLGNVLLHEKGESLFPWLIDFDKAEDDRPVVFDLAKLEIEAYHKIAHELFWELRQTAGHGSDDESRRLLRRFEDALEAGPISDLNHLWAEFENGPHAVPDSLKHRFAGFLAYLMQVHKRVDALGIGKREFLIGRAVYAMCCLKFKHLYKAGDHMNAPFPAKVVLWKLEALVEALDAENGIFLVNGARKGLSVAQRAIGRVVEAVRKARTAGSDARKIKPLMDLLGPQLDRLLRELKRLPDYKKDDDWACLLRLLRDKHLPGSNRWMRELLWYARDYGLSTDAARVAEFTKAMVAASMPTGGCVEVREGFTDYASTGRPGNTYPAAEMFRHLADQPDNPLIKISSRGESAGTIDILEDAGIPLCQSLEAVEAAILDHGWALVESSEAFCEVDKILMKLRKQCGCMKVEDLAMTSISAKKWALGITSFHVQVVSGYDAKFATLLHGGEVDAVGAKWKKVWERVIEPATGKVEVSSFDSDSLNSWKENNKATVIVFGKKLLAAKIWDGLGAHQKARLTGRLPARFIGEMENLVEVLVSLKNLANQPASGSGSTAETSEANTFILNLSQIESPQHQARVSCREYCVLENHALRELAVVLFRFSCDDIRPLVHVPFFDGLFSEISQSGHPMASLVFGKTWITVVCPRYDLPTDLQSWSWRVLRDGFGHAKRNRA